MKLKRALLATFHDLAMAGISLVLAFVLRVGFEDTLAQAGTLLYAVPLYVAVAGVSFHFFGMNRGLWRYASIPDLVAIAKAVAVSIFVFLAVLFSISRLEGMPRSVPVIQGIVLVMLLGGPRLLYRLMRDPRLYQNQKKTGPAIPVLLAGAGDGAELFIRSAQNDNYGRYKVVGVLNRKAGYSIHGVPILGKSCDLEKVVEELTAEGKRPQRLIFTGDDPTDESNVISALASTAEKLGLKLSRLPGLTEFKEGLFDQNLELRSVAIEDILGRAQAPLDLDAISGLIRGKRVLVTGAGGSIGRELCRQIAGFSPARMLLADNCEFNLYEVDGELDALEIAPKKEILLADVRDRARTRAIFDQFRPEVVFHAAALKHVHLVETNPEEGMLTNAIGTRNVADAALEFGTLAFVQISTDKAVNPAGVMGASKRLAEYYCQALDLETGRSLGAKTRTHFMTVRFGNVMGSSGSVVPLFKKQIARGGPLTVTHPDIRRYFMTVREAVGLVLQASAHGLQANAARGRIFVLDMGEPVKIVDIARRMIRLANLEPERDVKIVFTGLRPGEKLFEELFDQNETPADTDMPGVLAAAPKPIELEFLRKVFERLEDISRKGLTDELMQMLAHVVPGFRKIGYDENEHDSGRTRQNTAG